MPEQLALPGLRDAVKKKVTRREKFLAEMDTVVPWGRLLVLIEPHYPKIGPKRGRPPIPLEAMLRVYFLQNWFALSDPMVEESLYDSEAMRRLLGIELGDDGMSVVMETTLHRYVWLENQQQPQSAPGSKAPLQAIMEWRKLQPQAFKKQPYYLPGYDRWNIFVCYRRAEVKYELVFVSGADRHQRPYYESSARHRAFNLAGYFRRRGYATVIVSQHVFEEHYETFETADLVSFHHPDISECMVRYLMNNKRKQILIADYDDLVFDVSSLASNPAVLDRSEDITNISSYLASKAEIGQMFDHRTASTVPLAEEASRIMGGETTVIHNALDPAYLDMAKRIFELRDPTGVKFAFAHVSSSASHNSDLTIISSLIADYLNEFPSERMLLLGPVQIPSELEPFRDQIKRKEVQSFYAIPSLLAQCRMVLRPLTSNKFSRCESSLEFFEAAAIGVSVAASPIPDIDRFESPLLHKCTNPQEWEAALRAPVLKETRLEQEVKGLRAEGSLARQASLWKSHFLETATHAKWE